jgi:uncharacterized protein (DUF2336 family)
VSDPAPLDLIEPAGIGDPAPAPSRARAALFKRLADVVSLPESRVNAFERSMTADLLVDMLREASVEERAKVARRLAGLKEIPHSLVRLLLRDDISVARPLLEDSASLGDADLIDCIRSADIDHRLLIAARRGLGEVVAEVLAEPAEPPVIEALLRNTTARLSSTAIELLVAASRDLPRIIPLMLRRPELRPRHAYVMFWWADSDSRRLILQRFAVSREVLQDAVGDVFAMAAEENWTDPLSRKALQFIERRQRNRAAIDKSPYGSLDEAVGATARGMTREKAEEISYLCGIKPMTGAKILTDPGGEPLAILCKATGLPRAAVRQLWTAMRRPEADSEGNMTPALERVLIAYDMLAVDRAQTVLRYWNWSLSSAMSPTLMRAIREGDEAAIDQYSTPERAAMLALGRDFAD